MIFKQSNLNVLKQLTNRINIPHSIITKCISQSAVIFCCSMIIYTNNVFSQQSDITTSSNSFGQYKQTSDSNSALKEQPMASTSLAIPYSKPLSNFNVTYNIDAQYSIYDANSFLMEDIDQDGYFRTFSVEFDADIYSYDYILSSDVYAVIYLSRDNGAWEHLYTTDIFVITGDSSDDTFEVVTTLGAGYPSAYYDVLIDLYQAGSDELVASYSAYDNNSLYALPLENRDLDENYTEVYVDHAGSIPMIFILLLLALFIIKSRHSKG